MLRHVATAMPVRCTSSWWRATTPLRSPNVPRTVSVLADAGEWVRRDYEKVTSALHAAHERGNALDREVAAWQGHHAEAVRQRDGLQAEIGEMRAVIAAREESLAAAEAWRCKLEDDISVLRADGGRSGLPRLLRHLLRRVTRTGRSS